MRLRRIENATQVWNCASLFQYRTGVACFSPAPRRNGATEEVNRGLQTVASATEEMSASIQEIAKNATEAAKVANNAMKTASDTNLIVAKLGTSSAQIG
ncbi:MAG: hypothetical protein WCE52_18065 [Candidatus Acidiferrum sp.]